MGKLSINGPFSMATLNNQSVYIEINPAVPHLPRGPAGPMGGPLRSLRVLDASEGLHLGRLSLLEAKALAKKIAGIQRFKVKKYLYILIIYIYIDIYIYTYIYR